MKLIFKIQLIISIISFGCIIAQDTVKVKINVKTPPTYFNQVRFASGFSSPNGARVDLFNKIGFAKTSIPDNYVGSQNSINGESYLGISTYNGKVSFGMKGDLEYGISQTQFNDIGYVQAELPNSLGKKEYHVTFKISLADYSGMATSGWGVYFTDKAMVEGSDLRNTLIPQITYPGIIKEKDKWVEMSAKYKTTGTEKFMIIGCFNKNYNVEETLGGTGFAIAKAYYYVSNIKLIEIPEDRDKDGVFDFKDRCPDVFGLASLKGCPDTDGDSIADIDDACPRNKGLAAFNGCPDTDGDGIEDSKDRCPTVFGKAADGGCPINEAEIMTKNIEGMINRTLFEVGKDVIKPSSFENLDDVASILKANPTLKITINEIIDDGADALKSKALSNKRANAISNYLVNKGCDPTMIKYGGSSIDDTKSIDGGRRVIIQE